MMLYEAYSRYVDEENARSEEEQERYREDMDVQKDNFNLSNFQNQVPKMPDISSISKGFMNGSNFNF